MSRSFLQSLPSSELDELMRLVQTDDDSKASTTATTNDLGRSGPNSSLLAFLAPKEIESSVDVSTGVWSASGVTRPAAAAANWPDASEPPAIHSIRPTQPTHTRTHDTNPHASSTTTRNNSSRARPWHSHPPAASSSLAASHVAGSVIAAASSSAAEPAVAVAPYCTVESHAYSSAIDSLESFGPTPSDFADMADLDDLHSQVVAHRRHLDVHDGQLADLRDTIVSEKVADARRRVTEQYQSEQTRRVEQQEQREDQAASDRLARRRPTSVASVSSGTTGTPTVGTFEATLKRGDLTDNPYLRRYKQANAHAQQQQAARRESRAASAAASSAGSPANSPRGHGDAFDVSGPALASLPSARSSSPPHDPLAQEIITRLSSDLVSLQAELNATRARATEESRQAQADMQRIKDESRVHAARVKRAHAAQISHLEQVHADRLSGATTTGQHEMAALKEQVTSLSAALRQSRDLLRSFLKERGMRDKKTKQEAAIFDLLCQPAFLETTLPPDTFPPVLRATAQVGAPPMPPFASSLVTEVPSATLPHTVVNDELASLRLALAKTREELRSSRAAEETASRTLAEAVTAHKEHRTRENTKRLRLQAQLLGAVRRVKWSTDEAARLDALNKEQAAYVVAVEAKLLHASKRLMLQQEAAQRATQRRAARATGPATKRAASVSRDTHRASSPQPDWDDRERRRSASVTRPSSARPFTDVEGVIMPARPASAREPLPPRSTQLSASSRIHTHTEHQDDQREQIERESDVDVIGKSGVSVVHSPPRPASHSSVPLAISSPEADRWMHQLEHEVAALQTQLEKAHTQAPTVIASDALARSQRRHGDAAALASHASQQVDAPAQTRAAQLPDPSTTAAATVAISRGVAGDASPSDDDRDPDDTSVGSFDDDVDDSDFDEEDLVRTFSTDADGELADANSSALSLKEQLAHLTAQKQHADQQVARLRTVQA